MRSDRRAWAAATSNRCDRSWPEPFCRRQASWPATRGRARRSLAIGTGGCCALSGLWRWRA
eukprot:12356378-Alexandrium_andersonii.AAC.1